MKLELLSFLIPLFSVISASESSSPSSFEGECFNEDEYVKLPSLPNVAVWDCVNLDPSDLTEIKSSSNLRPFEFSFVTFFGSIFNYASPLKQVAPPPFGDIESSPGSDLDLNTLAVVMNCNEKSLKYYDESILKRVIALKDVQEKKKILSHLANIGDKSLFELFVENNIPFILPEIININDFHFVAFDCIKVDSINSLLNIMLHLKFALNAPQAVIVASMNGSYEILKFILEQRNHPDYAWEWKKFDGGNGYMFDFGPDPFSAALFFGSMKALSDGHLNCLQILVSNGVDISFKDYILLKESASIQGSEAFKTLFTNVNVPKPVMDEILISAVKNNNDELVEYLLSLNFDDHIMIENHLIPAVRFTNKRLIDMLLARVDRTKLNSKSLILAASTGNIEIFIELLKISDEELFVPALCSCISNENLQHFVPHIVANFTMSSDVVAQALLHAVKVRSLPLVKLFLNQEACVSTKVSPSFIEALLTNDVDIVNEFFSKFVAADLIRPNILSKTVSTLFQVQAWNSMKLFVDKYYGFNEFPKFKFVSKIILTDQVEIAELVSEKGATFPKSELVNVRHEGMRTLVMKKLSAENLSKSQIKNRK